MRLSEEKRRENSRMEDSLELGELDLESKSQGRGLWLQKHRATGTTDIARFNNLPYEIILNILSRPPVNVKSVLRCRCVSKTWCNIIDHLSLTMPNCAAVEKHSELVLLSYPIEWQDKTRFFSLKDDGNNILRASKYPIVELVNAHYYYLAAINLGILIFRDTRLKGKPSFLLNPCRGEVLMLPSVTVPASPPQMLVDNYGFGFDSTTNACKVVRIYSWKEELHYMAEVYTLGTKSWRQISSVPPYHVDVMPISAYGDVHWMVYCSIPDGSAKSMIISFDFEREEFKLTSHPDFPCKKYIYFRLVDLRGSLAILDLSPTTYMEMWVLKDYDRNEWAQEYRISIELWRREEEGLFRVPGFDPDIINVVGAWEDGLLFEVAMGYKFFYWNLKTGSLRHITPSNIPGLRGNSFIYSYTGSLVSLRNHGNLMAKELGTGNCFDLTTAGMDSVLRAVKI